MRHKSRLIARYVFFWNICIVWCGINILEKCRPHQCWFRKKIAQNLVDITILSRLYSPCIFFASSFSRVGGLGGWGEANLSNDTHRQPSNQDLENNPKTKIKTKTKTLQLFFFLQGPSRNNFFADASSWQPDSKKTSYKLLHCQSPSLHHYSPI